MNFVLHGVNLSVRRILDIPHNSHSFLLPVLSDSLPIFDEICKRSSRFIVSCLFCPSRLVNSIVWYGVLLGRYNSVVGRNALICCERYGWELNDFVMGSVNLSKHFLLCIVTVNLHNLINQL